MRTRLLVLTRREQDEIADATFRLLSEVGVRVSEAAACGLLERAGAQLEGDRAYLPEALVRAACRRAPPGITLYDRNGQPAFHLERRAACFGAHTDAPDVLDPYTGLRRPCMAADVRNHAVLIDALSNIAFATASGLVADVPAELADRLALAECLANTTKPVLTMPVTLEALDGCRRLAAAAVGGDDALCQRPNIVVYAEPVSPLSHPDESLRKLLYCADHGLPVAYVPFAAMGGTAPQSLPGILVQLCAETLSALTIHQLRQPGAPFIFGGMASLMDMRTTIFSYGAPEFQLGNTAMAEMARYFGLPNFGTAGTSDSQCFDGQAILEATSSCMNAMLSGAHLVHDVGLLGSATVVMPQMIVATDEIVAMLARVAAGVPALPGAAPPSLWAGAADRGEFVTQEHTLAHYRDAWYPNLLYRGGARAWEAGPQSTFQERVTERTRRLMESHRPEPLPPERAEALAAVVAGIRTQSE